ncbi:MAG: DnaJ domain-containing protein [Candidatus Uhrbacteria bacterium]
MTYYQLLGIAEDATAVEIRNAYRKKVATLHPDRFAKVVEPTEATDERNRRFAEARTAYETLSNSRNRYLYDRRNRVPQGLGDLLATPQGQRAMARLLPRAPKQSRDGNDRVIIAPVPMDTLANGGAIDAPAGLPDEFDLLFLPPNAGKTPWARLPERGEPGENDGTAGDLYVLLVPTDR